MSNEIDQFLLGGGGSSARFETVGDTVTGTVLSAEVKDQTDLATGAVLKWDNGDVRKQLVVRLQTTQHDDEDDDGVRAVYVKGSKKAGSRSLHDAVASAVRLAGAKSLEVGGTLTVTYTGEEPSATRGFNPRKLYSASYVAPAAVSVGEFLGTPAAPAPAPAAAPAAPAMSAEQFAAWQAYQASQAS